MGATSITLHAACMWIFGPCESEEGEESVVGRFLGQLHEFRNAGVHYTTLLSRVIKGQFHCCCLWLLRPLPHGSSPSASAQAQQPHAKHAALINQPATQHRIYCVYVCTFQRHRQRAAARNITGRHRHRLQNPSPSLNSCPGKHIARRSSPARSPWLA